jgi:hypothetical protein
MFAPTFVQKLARYATQAPRYRFEYAPTNLSTWLLRRKFQDSAEFSAWFLNLSRARRSRIGRLIGIEPCDRHDARNLWSGYLSGVENCRFTADQWEAWHYLHVERYCPAANGRILRV